MKLLVLSILGLLFCSKLFAQYENASLLVQSPDGKTVKLAWFLKSWNKDITGFDIKRKDGLQDWVKLNSQPIIPEISSTRNLAIVESDKEVQQAIRDRIFKLIAGKKLVEAEDTDFLKKLNTDDKALVDISNMVAHDYDLALISGFAYVDHTVTKKTDYQYGLFIQGTDKMLDSVLWNYGQIPDLNAVSDITSKANTTTKGIQIFWTADMNKMRSGDVAGFNIYREGIRLNSSPIQSDSKDPAEFTWSDRSASGDMPAHYSISAESLFGIEGIIRPYIYNPADHPVEYEKTAVTEITSLGYYFKEGINVKWSFPKESEHFLKGFYVEKDNMPDGYKQVSSLLGPATRVFIDKSSSPVTGYIRFRIVAVYNDKTMLTGTERVYNYFPVGEPPVPQNVTGKITIRDNRPAITLYWDPQMAGDTVTDYYKVYVCGPQTDKFFSPASASIRAADYTYPLSDGRAGVYRFCVSAVGKSKNETTFSDTVTLAVPVNK